MSNRTTLRTNVRYRLGRGSDITDTMLDGWLNDALIDLCTRRIEIQSLRGIGNAINTVPGLYYYAKSSTAFALEYIEDLTNERRLDVLPGGLAEWLQVKQGASNGPPTRYIVNGNQIWLTPTPDDFYQLRTYVYLYPTWGALATDEPSIEREWHYGIELVATEHAMRALNNDERAAQVAQEFEMWLAQRDTNIKRGVRKAIPQRGVSPATAVRRNFKTGV